MDALIVAMARRAPRGHAWLGDEVQRASGSVVTNLAEAMGREGADRARTLRISRGSALELDAARTFLAQRGGCAQAARVEAKGLILRVVAMFSKLRERASP